MGLDMFLYKHKQYKDNDKTEVAYWRKANQIREWFVNHTDLDYGDNCEIIPLTRENLVELVNDCNKVLDNHNLAPDIMPTSSGFFFGGTDYDDWYYEDLRYTVKVVGEILETTDFENEVIEYSDWW